MLRAITNDPAMREGLRHAVDEIFLLWITAEIGKGERRWRGVVDPIFPLSKVFPAAAFRAELILSTYVRVGPARFLSSFSPRSMNSSFRRSRTWRSAPSERQMPPGTAMPSSLPLDQPTPASRTGASGCLQVRIDLRWRERPRQCFGWGHCRGLLRVAGSLRQVHRTPARVNGILPTRQRRRSSAATVPESVLD